METAPKPRILLLVGLPGSGKSTWAKGRGGVLSSDALREVLIDDAQNQSIHRRVFGVLRYLLKQRLELKRPLTIVDATNLTRDERRPYVMLADLYDCEIEAVFFDVSAEECMARNRGRDRAVPEDVISMMAEKLVAPSLSEGFTRISVLKLQE